MTKALKFIVIISLLVTSMTSCGIPSYRLNGASIDYTRIKTINISDFQNLAPIVYPPLAQKFSEDLKHRFQTRTRLVLTNNVGDLNIEGEIIGYDLTAEAVQEDAYAARTKLTMRIKVRYTNTIDEKESFEKEFSSFASFDSNKMFNEVQDALCAELTEDIINQIFNATVENW
ncbi:LptE family protein [Porphyromonadaceae bacterium W3.11]|nr:LptE family protein [Porphyromonadaceae bacterium W3.11]